MTDNEIAEMLKGLKAQLVAKNVPVLTLACYVDNDKAGTVISIGNPETVQEMLLFLLADRNGWKVVPK